MSKAKSGENNPMYGKEHTPETKEKMSSSQNTTGYFRVGKKKTLNINKVSYICTDITMMMTNNVQSTALI